MMGHLGTVAMLAGMADKETRLEAVKAGGIALAAAWLEANPEQKAQMLELAEEGMQALIAMHAEAKAELGGKTDGKQK